MRAYIAAWVALSVVAVLVVARSPRAFAIARRDYWRLLAAPWKLATFAVAAAGLTVIAPYSGDPTWDYADAAFMSVLAFTTAPFAVGALYKAARRRLPARHGFVAACVWLFSASWSYDLYILLRDGRYPPTWRANLLASSVLYASAGLLWSLEATSRGASFAFLRDDWPTPLAGAHFSRVLALALPLMLLVGLMILAFFVPALGGVAR